jgi:hypothetical protein
MISCPHCQAENRDDALRCAWCGYPLVPSTAAPDVAMPTEDAPESAPLEPEQAEPDDLEDLLPDAPLPAVPLPEITPAEQDIRAPSPTELRDAVLLHRIATEPAPLPPPRHPRHPAIGAIPPAAVRALLGLLVLLALGVPLLTGDWLGQGATPTLMAAGLDGLRALEPEARVVVAFDLAPSAMAELSPALMALLSELGERPHRLLAISTRPEGVDLARMALEQTPGQAHVLLGYLAGDAAGMRLAVNDLSRALAFRDGQRQPLADHPSLQGIIGLGDVDAILIVSDDAGLVRRWLEQVQAYTAMPLYALVTARIEPQLVPYVQTGQLAALAAGANSALPGAEVTSPVSTRLYSADGYLVLWAAFVLALGLGFARRLGAQERQPS